MDVIIEHGFESWRRTARTLVMQHVNPEVVHWRLQSDTQADLLSDTAPVQCSVSSCDGIDRHNRLPSNVSSATQGAARVPREFLRLAASVACHSDHERWSALYRVLYRLTHGEASLLDVATDPDVHRLTVMDKAVRRDVHKMHAFVRFRAVTNSGIDGASAAPGGAQTAYVAWFEPAHDIVQRATPFLPADLHRCSGPF